MVERQVTRPGQHAVQQTDTGRLGNFKTDHIIIALRVYSTII